MRRPRAVVVTAIAEELNALMALVDCDDLTDSEDNSVYYVGIHKNHSGRVNCAREWEIYLPMPLGAGNVQASAATVRVAQRLNPDVIMFVGVAGGIPGKVNMFDVVIADRIFHYEPGKADQELLPRPDIARPTRLLLERAKAEIMNERWKRVLHPDIPNIYFTARVQPIAAGELLIKRSDGEHFKHIMSVSPRAVAVEQEGFGVLIAAEQSSVNAIVIRGISDLLDNKSDDVGVIVPQGNHDQRRAARHAGAFALCMLDNLDVSWIDGIERIMEPGTARVTFVLEGSYDPADDDQRKAYLEAFRSLFASKILKNHIFKSSSILIAFDADSDDGLIIKTAYECGLLKLIDNSPIRSVSVVGSPPSAGAERIAAALRAVRPNEAGWEARLTRIVRAIPKKSPYRRLIERIARPIIRTEGSGRDQRPQSSAGQIETRPIRIGPQFEVPTRAPGFPTVSYAASELGVSVKTIRNWIASGTIPEPPSASHGRGFVAIFPPEYMRVAKEHLDRHRDEVEIRRNRRKARD